MRVVRRILNRIAVRFARGLYRRRGWIVLAAALVAGMVVITGVSPVPSDLVHTPPDRGSVGPVAIEEGEPEATAAYIRGQQEYDANLVWSTFSERMRASLQRNQVTFDDIKRRLEATRERGIRIAKAHYVGSHPIPSGKIVFYVVTETSAARGEVAYVPYTFTLGADGKIDDID